MIRGRDFLDVVDAIAGRQEEAFIRTSTGRFYYAAYLECRHFCERYLGYIRTQSSREHGEIPRLLTHHDSELVDQLLFPRSIRNAADYDLALSAETVTIQRTQALSLSRRIIAHLDELMETTAPR